MSQKLKDVLVGLLVLNLSVTFTLGQYMPGEDFAETMPPGGGYHPRRFTIWDLLMDTSQGGGSSGSGEHAADGPGGPFGGLFMNMFGGGGSEASQEASGSQEAGSGRSEQSNMLRDLLIFKLLHQMQAQPGPAPMYF